MKFYLPPLYQPSCRKLYEHYEAEIRHLVPSARIEHIGASAVPGAISKGDLDIFVGVRGDLLETAADILQSLGFEEKRDTLRTTELCMLVSTKGEDVALQIVANDSEFENFLRFRDLLLCSPVLLNQYNALKRECSDMSMDKYRQCKSSFIYNALSSDSSD